MNRNCRILAAALAALVLGGPSTTETAQAEGNRVVRTAQRAAAPVRTPQRVARSTATRAALQPTAAAANRSPISAPRLLSNRVTTTRSVTTRTGTPRVVARRVVASRGVASRAVTSVRSGGGTRVASFVQRAPRAATRAVARPVVGDVGGLPEANSRLRSNDYQFRTGDFFDRQQQIGTQ